VRQVWFAGVHCDVGGSYPPERSGLSQIALAWMVGEAEKTGLQVDPDRRRAILSSPPPDHRAPASESLAGWWTLAEHYPKKVRWKVTTADGAEQWETSHRCNRSPPRNIPEGSLIHESVVSRRDDVAAYKPANVPEGHHVVD
jgi:uncharacterized protein (DUF2235 family)